VTSYFNNGKQEIINRMNDVYSIAEDLEGAIWIGTSKGVAVYNNPQEYGKGEVFMPYSPASI
jgi:ligand-binding sensor domain-containing protein